MTPNQPISAPIARVSPKKKDKNGYSPEPRYASWPEIGVEEYILQDDRAESFWLGAFSLCGWHPREKRQGTTAMLV